MLEFIVKYWTEVAFTGVMGWSLKKLTTLTAREEATRLGVQALLRDRLIQSYNFCMKQGFCSITDRDNIANMYKQYHNLGVNGVMDGLVEDVLKLPTEVRI